jgi:hypothetical protein
MTLLIVWLFSPSPTSVLVGLNCVSVAPFPYIRPVSSFLDLRERHTGPTYAEVAKQAADNAAVLRLPREMELTQKTVQRKGRREEHFSKNE